MFTWLTRIFTKPQPPTEMNHEAREAFKRLVPPMWTHVQNISSEEFYKWWVAFSLIGIDLNKYEDQILSMMIALMVKNSIIILDKNNRLLFKRA